LQLFTQNKITMKRSQLFFVVALFITVVLQSCLKDDCTTVNTYLRYTPIYKTIDEVRDGIKNGLPRSLKHPGKIYVYGQYLFVNEQFEGIHIINNANPSSPQNIAFIEIPGNRDFAVNGQYVYADNGIDLVTINIADINNPQVVNRAMNVFNLSVPYDAQKGYIVSYLIEPVSVEQPCSNGGNVIFAEGDVVFAPTSNGSSSSGSSVSGGIAGSMARFNIANNHLYTVDEMNLKPFSLNDPAMPTQVDSLNLGWGGIETIFAHGNHLFVGSQSGMYICNIDEPSHPTYRSQFQHARACDPVFVNGTYAYVTLRDGNECNGYQNQLDVVDISNLDAPVLAKTYSMTNPHGLTVNDTEVIVCEGEYGLRVLDKTNPLEITELAFLDNIKSYDVIRLNNDVAIIVGKDGLYEYDMSNVGEPTFLSHIPVDSE
jgi:hypothetical protein